jgi:hypothetical protein
MNKQTFEKEGILFFSNFSKRFQISKLFGCGFFSVVEVMMFWKVQKMGNRRIIGRSEVKSF